jgi:two-component system phosphate regulon sensor histidine kinase PhoR
MILDLKLIIFLGLLLLFAAVLFGILIGRRWSTGSIFLQTESQINQLWQTFATLPFGIVFLSLDLRCLYANENACYLLGDLTRGRELPDEPWRVELYKDLKKIRLSPRTKTYYRTLSLPSEQVVSWWMDALPDVTVIILTDLTGQRKAENSARLFLSNLSHEIRTPLTAILAHIEVLRLKKLPPLVQQNSVNLIYQATSRISHLVQNLLELSRLETSSNDEHVLVDMILIAEESISELILRAEEQQIPISLNAIPPLPRVLGNANWLKQVFLNVIDNAIKYSRPGDQVNVRLESRPEGLSVTIQDTGPGIPPEHLPYVTQRLYRGNTDVLGSGIGLALVEEILRHHHSRLEITSQSSGDQTGTNVHFVLPALLKK